MSSTCANVVCVLRVYVFVLRMLSVCLCSFLCVRICVCVYFVCDAFVCVVVHLLRRGSWNKRLQSVWASVLLHTSDCQERLKAPPR